MRYIILVALNLPVILVGVVDILTQYKMKHVSSARFRHQVLLWSTILILLVSSFPLYNHLNGRPPLDSHELSAFDIVEITAIVYLIYIAHNHRRKIEQNEKVIRDLHQEISIKLSGK